MDANQQRQWIYTYRHNTRDLVDRILMQYRAEDNSTKEEHVECDVESSVVYFDANINGLSQMIDDLNLDLDTVIDCTQEVSDTETLF